MNFLTILLVSYISKDVFAEIGLYGMMHLFLTGDDDEETATPSDRNEQPVEQQVMLYYSQPVSRALQPLSFWQQSVSSLPRLAALARRLLAVPGSSVPSERLFSTAGQIVTDLRNRLSPESVSQLLFLNKNADL